MSEKQIYQRFIIRKRWIIILTLILTLLVGIVAVWVGSLQLNFSELMRAFARQGEGVAVNTVWNIRLPRVVAAIVVGAALAVSGAVMQCVLRNPLASPSTLGVSQGAAFGAAFGIIVFGGGVVHSANATSAVSINHPYIVTLCAFFFGTVSSLIVIGIARLKKNIGSAGLVLTGVALSSLFSGGSTLLQYFSDDTRLGAIVFWTFGNLGNVHWPELILLSAVSCAAFLYFMMNRWNYNALDGGLVTAKSLGVNTQTVTLISMGICSLLTAVAVSFVGIISFIGLIAPHIMRRLIGSDYRYLIPGSAVAGALVLLLADTFARTVVSPVILPIGALTSFLGAPLFLFILFRGKRNHA